MNLWDSVFGEAGAQVVDLMGEGLRAHAGHVLPARRLGDR